MIIKKRFRSAMAALIMGQGLLLSFGAPAQAEFDAKERAHWAFQKVTRPTLPQLKNSQWLRNSIDAFVLAPLEGEKIAPAPQRTRLL